MYGNDSTMTEKGEMKVNYSKVLLCYMTWYNIT